MATSALSCAYKETRLNLDSAIPGSTVIIRLPSYGSSLPRNAPKRPHITEPAAAEDEGTFKLRHLATSGSVYHRRYHSSPKSFLWRTLEENKVLAIRAVDLCKKEKVQDANVTLRLYFPSPIRPSCIAFAETREHDVLIVYVLTASNHLYILSLRPDFFRRPASTEDNVVDWCKIHYANGLGLKTTHRLVALQADELLATFSDGGMMRLEKKHGGDGWAEFHYNETDLFVKLTSSFPFRNTNTHRVGNINFDRASVVSLTSNPTNIYGNLYIFTVCMDHQLRVWNLVSGKIAYVGDILTQSRLASDMTRYTIDPTASQLVRYYENSNGEATVITYSPMGLGQFKFWAVHPAEHGSLNLKDKFPDQVFELQAPSSDQWTLLDFSVVVGSDVQTTDLWVLWKNNLSLRVHKIGLELASDARDLKRKWKNGWVAMATETLEESPLPIILASDPLDSTDKWLEYILFPGRFSSATIETALNIYENSLGRAKDVSARRSRRVAERMCSLVASTASLAPSNGAPNYQQFRLATDTQWRRFYRLLVELEKSRGEALSLSIDSDLGLPWITTADGLSIIRACSTLETVWHNPDEDRHMPAQKQVASLIDAAAVFRDGCPDNLIHNCNAVLKAEICEDPLLTDPQRLRSFYEKTNFAGQIGDEEYSQLIANLGGNFRTMNDGTYEDLFGIMAELESPNKQESHPLTDFGKKAVVKGVQEIIELHRMVCFDQLVLLVFFETEVDQREEETQLETAAIFKRLLLMLSRLELLKWLAITHITIRHSRTSTRSDIARDGSLSASKKSSVEELRTITVLEGCLFHLLGFDITSPGHNIPSIFTVLLMQLCDPESVYELEPYLIQCFLLKHHRIDLALEFNRFCHRDPFSTYIQGRAYLAANDLETASMFFKRASFGLSVPVRQGSGRVSTYSLLDDTEWNLLYAGMPKYYAHIVSLFDKEKLYSHVAEFANLSLQFNPFPTQTELTALRTEILSRLFNAYIQTSRFELAHSTLSLFTDHALQSNSLRVLVLRMCESSYAPLLVSLPFLGLQDAVDEILQSKCATVPDVNIGIPYHKILYAWRIKRNNFRGAAAVLLERLQRLKGTRDGDKREGADGFETQVTKGYLMLINALSCVDPKQAWILSEGTVPGRRNSVGGGGEEKRKVLTLADLRGEYGAELDRIAAIENDQFGFLEVDDDGDVMDVL